MFLKTLWQHLHGRQPLTSPNDPFPPVFTPSCNPLPLSVGWTQWLASNKQNTVSDGMPPSRLAYKKTPASFYPLLLTFSCSLTCSLWWKPASMSRAAPQRGPYRKELREASSQQPARSWPMWELVSEFGNVSSPSWALRWPLPRPTLECQLVRGLEPEDPAKPHLDSWETVR